MLHKVMLVVSSLGALLSVLLLEGFIKSSSGMPNWVYHVGALVSVLAASRAYVNIKNADKH